MIFAHGVAAGASSPRALRCFEMACSFEMTT